ncbi:succinate/fumarate transporter-related [Anaeramoeba flamelloides]|nr:succinate/fumarate transporter-related [Anaeramoeba flamelloides]
MTEQNEKNPSQLYQRAFFFGLGGSVTAVRTLLMSPLCGGPELGSYKCLFFNSGIQHSLMEKIDKTFKENMEEYNNSKEFWKITITAGIAIGSANALVDTVFTNVHNHHKAKRKENPKPKSPIHSAFDLVHTNGVRSLFDGYFSKAFHKSLFTTSFKTCLSFNNRLVNKMLPGEHGIVRMVAQPFLTAGLSGAEAILFSKPVEETVRGLMSGEGVEPKKLAKETLHAAKTIFPSIGLSVTLWSNGKRALKPSHRAIRDVFNKIHSKH